MMKHKSLLESPKSLRVAFLISLDLLLINLASVLALLISCPKELFLSIAPRTSEYILLNSSSLKISGPALFLLSLGSA